VSIYVDQLKAFLKKFVGLFWKMVLNGILSGRIGLVNVNSFSRTKHLSKCSVVCVYSQAANCVVEYVNSICSGAS
jgi:hypothetical protein